MQLAERTEEPGQQIGGADDAGDDRGLRRRYPAVTDRRYVRGVGKQVPERRDGLLRPGQVLLQSREVRGDELVPGTQVRRVQHRADLLKRHV